MSDEPRYTERLTTRFSEEQMEIIESISQSSREISEMYNMSKAEANRALVNYAIEHIGDKPILEELVDEPKRLKHQTKREREQIRDVFWHVDMVEGWQGRVENWLNTRLRNSYRPRGARILAQGYWADLERCVEHLSQLDFSEYDLPADVEAALEDWETGRLEELREWLDNFVDAYEVAYRVDADHVEVGEDLLSVRDEFDAVLHTIGDVVEIVDNADAAAVQRRIAGDYALEEETVELLLDTITGDDHDTVRALKTGEGLEQVRQAALEAARGEDTLGLGGADTSAGELESAETEGEPVEIDVSQYVTESNIQTVVDAWRDEDEAFARQIIETNIVGRQKADEVIEAATETLIDIARERVEGDLIKVEYDETTVVAGGGD